MERRLDSAPDAPQVKTRERLLWLAALLFVGWQAVGALPLSPVESDGIAVALGAVQRLTDPAHCPELAYNFHGTSGVYVIVGQAWQAVGGDAFALYGALTLLVTLGGFALMTLFVAKTLRASVPMTALLLGVFLPEFLTSSWYANTNAFAMLALCAALLLTQRPGWLYAGLTGVAFGVAGWLRGDVAMACIGVAALLFRATGKPRSDWLHWLGRSTVCGATAGVTALGLMHASGASLEVLRATVSGVAAVAPGTSSSGMPIWVVGHATFAPLATYLLLGVALTAMLHERRWSLLLPVGIGALPMWLWTAPYLATPKGLLNIVPFLGLAVVFAVRWLLDGGAGPRRWLLTGLLVALALQAVVGLRLTLASKPWLHQDDPALLSLGHWEHVGPFSRVEIVIGAGTVVPTDDGVRLLSGNLVAPWILHRRHREREAGMARLVALLEADSVAPAIVAQMVEGATNARLALQRAGYHCTNSRREFETGALFLDYVRPASPTRPTTFTSQVLLEHPAYQLSTLAPLHLHRALYVIASGRELAAVRAQAPEATVLLDTHDFMPVAAVAYDQSLHDAPLPR